MASARGAQAAGAGQADGVPRDHQRGHRGRDRELARPRHEAGRSAGGPAHARPPLRVRGVERRVPPHRTGDVGRAGPERRHPLGRRPRARPHGIPQRLVLGPRRQLRGRRSRLPGHARRTRRQAHRVRSRLRREHRRAEPERRRRTARRAGRGRPRDPARGPALPCRVGGDALAHRTSEGAVHHVDAATRGRAQAGVQRGAHDARCPGSVRARPDHLHAYRLHVALRAGSERGAPADRVHVRRHLPSGAAPGVPQQGEERAGGARGDPTRG